MKKTIKTISILLSLLILTINSVSFAATDQFRAFRSYDFEDSDSVSQAVSYAVWTFQDLGYANVDGTNTYTKTNDRSVVLNYIGGSGNNYGFFVYAHGNSNLFTMRTGDTTRYIYPSNISGNWHLVFLNCCSCMSTDSFADAFNTVGYSNRASMGWYNTVTIGAAEEWWSHFYSVAGTTNLRSACLAAADQCTGSTPIRIYGDKTWNGMAW